MADRITIVNKKSVARRLVNYLGLGIAGIMIHGGARLIPRVSDAYNNFPKTLESAIDSQDYTLAS